MKKYFFSLAITALLFSKGAMAEGWCEFEHYTVITHGTKTNQVHLNGKLIDQTSGIWVLISDGVTGNVNVSLALAAQMAGKKLSLYVDDANYTCANFPSWAPLGEVRHLRIL